MKTKNVSTLRICGKCEKVKRRSAFYLNSRGVIQRSICILCSNNDTKKRMADRRQDIKNFNLSFSEIKYLNKSNTGGPWYDQYKKD